MNDTVDDPGPERGHLPEEEEGTPEWEPGTPTHGDPAEKADMPTKESPEVE